MSQAATSSQTRRIGIFEIDLVVLNSRPKHIQELFGNMIVLEAQHSMIRHGWFRDSVTYIALCDEFDEIKYADEIPTYVFKFRKNEDGSITRLPVKKLDADN